MVPNYRYTGKNDYLFPIMKTSGLYRVNKSGHILTCKQMGGPTHIKGPWRRVGHTPGPNGRGQVRHHGKMVYTHRLVWFWFNGPISLKMEVDHINNKKLDCRLRNLQLLTRSQNQQKAERDGLIKRPPGPRPKMKASILAWWALPGVKERMSKSAKRGWEKRRAKCPAI
jgi:hypothetical protein